MIGRFKHRPKLGFEIVETPASDEGKLFCSSCTQGIMFASEMVVLTCIRCKVSREFCHRCLRRRMPLHPFVTRKMWRGWIMEHPLSVCHRTTV